MSKRFYDHLFTDAVQAMQAENGALGLYARQMAEEAPANDTLGDK